jgi:hypothetical protein
MKRPSFIAPIFLFLAALGAQGAPQGTPPGAPPETPPGAPYDRLKTDAERFFAEGSYARAHELYLEADSLNLPPAEARWVDFRVADTLWRSKAGTRTPDPTQYEEARQKLEALVRDIQRLEDRDRVWAEVKESLADFWWSRPDSKNWGAAWPFYQEALDWWAGSKAIPLARERYLKIVWTVASPPWREPYYYYGYYGNMLPLGILENALQISSTDEEKAHAHYLIAMTARNQGDEYSGQRVPEEFDAALALGKSTDWYDDALYNYAEWLQSYGRIVPLEDGGFRREPDYVKALELFRRLLSELKKGETRYYDQAKSAADSITRPVLGASVPHVFIPDSEIEYFLSWRNVPRIDLAIYPVDLTRDERFSRPDQGNAPWIQGIDLAGKEKIRSWSKDTADRLQREGQEGDYRPGQEAARLEKKLPSGAYILEARALGLSARDLILVTDATLVLKTSGKQALAYFADAMDGSPLSGARVYLGERWLDGNQWRTLEKEGLTNQDGIAVFDLRGYANTLDLFAAARAGDRQAFATGASYSQLRNEDSWRIYAFTDRPAYRPGEKAEWKLVARRYDGAVYSTPSREVVEFQINDPRGTKASEGKLALNEFGSAWSSLELTPAMPLGEYQVAFWTQGRKKHLGGATLFRLEEYKLPEFKVSVRTPEENGKKKAFRLGEKVEAEIEAEYYFGGPVANASVEVLVHQNPFYHYWSLERDFPWYYEDVSSRRYSWGGGQIIKREVLKTDSAGKVTLSFETPRQGGQDLEFRIEARVTDSSRREITGSGAVRVTRQRYYVYPRPEHSIYQPKDAVKVLFKSLDANDQPVEVEGTVKVTRDQWVEIWIDPSGKEVKGEELKRRREGGKAFPPPGDKAWRIKFQGYEHEEVLTRTLKTSKEGEAALSFSAEREGYYRIAWRSEDKGSLTVRAEATVWVATTASTELGYHNGGVEIILDKDTFRAGQKAPVLLSLPVEGRHVLFSVEGSDLYSYQVVHVTGQVKLLQLEVEEKHVPNVFLSALTVADRQLFLDTKEVVVPPAQNFLDVEIKSDRPEYQPQEEGTLELTVRDHEGKPVAAELGLGLVDESVYYIQQDYAGDPRQFYFGQKRGQEVQTHSTFEQKSYAELRDEKEKLALSSGQVDLLGANEERDDKKMEGQEATKLGQRERGFLQKRALGLKDVARAQAPAAEAAVAEGKADMDAEAKPDVEVRTDFRSTVLWKPDIVTGPDGKATIPVKFPDSLTSWKATLRAQGQGSQFGIASATVRTRLPLLVRLEAPRFFVVGDSTVVSAVIHNNTDGLLSVAPSVKVEGLAVVAIFRDGSPVKGKLGTLNIEAKGEARADWVVLAQEAGNARIQVQARAGKYADAMEKTYVVYEHGIEKFIAKSGKARGGDVSVQLELPKERRKDSTVLSVQVSPSLAVTMLDALPYLIDYPYGCTEQTMSRFLPAAITAKTLKDLGLEPREAMERLFGGIVEEHAGKTHPGGEKDLGKLDEMAQKGLERLYEFQHSDGGWGWWKQGESDHFMTAYVLWGLILGREADLDVKPGVADRAADYLEKEIVEEETNPDMQAWMLHALAVHHAAVKKNEPSQFVAKAFDNLWKGRDQLNAYTRALFALSAQKLGAFEKAKTLVRNLENGVKIDSAPDTSVIQGGAKTSDPSVMATAHWGEDGIYWRWSDGGVEATAFALRALLAIAPESKLVEPVTNWLIKNRRGAQWSNTRDTAITVLALNEYLRKSGEVAPDLEYEVLVNGHSVAARKLTAKDAFTAPSSVAIDRKLVLDGPNEVRIVRKSGKSPIYFAAAAQFFSLEEPVTPQGNEIFVRREYEKLAARRTLLKGYAYEKEPLADGGEVTSGQRVEVVLTIESKNNYEYLVFEDLKPAGLEAAEVRSGESLFARELKSGALERRKSLAASAEEIDYTGRSRWVYQELRDRKVALFIDKLPEGLWEIRYPLRAEVPGKFHGLPVLGHAMYVPEIRANGSETRIEVKDVERVRRAVVEK